MPLVGFQPPISADERPQTYAIDRADTGTGEKLLVSQKGYCSMDVHDSSIFISHIPSRLQDTSPTSRARENSPEVLSLINEEESTCKFYSSNDRIL